MYVLLGTSFWSEAHCIHLFINYGQVFYVSICRPDLIHLSELNRDTPEYNVENAFNVAEKELGVPRLLDVEGKQREKNAWKQNYSHKYKIKSGVQLTHFDWGVSSLICPNNVYFQKLPEFNLTRIQIVYGVPSLPQPQYVN